MSMFKFFYEFTFDKGHLITMKGKVNNELM